MGWIWRGTEREKNGFKYPGKKPLSLSSSHLEFQGGGGEGEVVAIRSTATRRAKRENQLWGQDCTGIHPRLHPCVSFSFSGAFSSSKGWTKMGVTFVKLGINDGWVRSLEWTSFDRLSESFPREEKGREGNGAFVCQINMKSWGER